MTTIFITIFQGVEAKNLLRTPVYRHLIAREDVRLVLLVRTPERLAFYQREFGHPRVAFEVVGPTAGGTAERLFSQLKFLLLRTPTTDLRRHMVREETGSGAGFAVSWVLNRIFARPLVRRIARGLDWLLVRADPYRSIFDRWQPDVLVAAHLFDDAEIALLRAARRRGVPVLGFINSWDKVTARSIIRLLPDRVAVFNETVADEMERHNDMPRDRIRVVGIPQYDHYADWKATERAVFLKRVGFGPDDRILLFAPIGESFSRQDWRMIDLLREWESGGRLPAGMRVFVRFQPNDRVDERELAARPWLRYDRPGTRFTGGRGVDWDMTEAEMAHLADTLFHASLLVCYASSISVDMAAFDRPVVNIDFEIESSGTLSASPRTFYRMDHYAKALSTGGIRRVHNADELLVWIARYAADPSLDREGRARLVAQQCGRFDGRAGERLARAILETALP